MIKLILILLFIFIFLQSSLWIGKNGILDFYKIKREISTIKLKNIQFKEKNFKLYTEIQDLDNKEAIEEKSRIELNMIKLGETYYRFTNK